MERVGRKALHSDRGDPLRGFAPSCPGVSSRTRVGDPGSRRGGDAAAELWLPGGKEVSRGCRHFAPSAEAPGRLTLPPVPSVSLRFWSLCDFFCCRSTRYKKRRLQLPWMLMCVARLSRVNVFCRQLGSVS